MIPFQAPQSPAIDCTEIIGQLVEGTAEKQQHQMNQLVKTDMTSTITLLISFHSQQQQFPNSSVYNTLPQWSWNCCKCR